MPRSKDGVSIIEVLISMVIIAVVILVVTIVVGSVKDNCVKGENRHEANKLSADALEQLLSLNYDNFLLAAAPLAPHDMPLPLCNLSAKYFGNRSYIVTIKQWGTAEYKEITVTTSWTYNNTLQSVTLTMLKRKS